MHKNGFIEISKGTLFNLQIRHWITLLAVPEHFAIAGGYASYVFAGCFNWLHNTPLFEGFIYSANNFRYSY
ncbi:MAG: hypothetical protein DI535_07240 [Citrobacter freundii]|nr:MAG: hypothetical protein DI535_07240 [Citrobacter freundii]